MKSLPIISMILFFVSVVNEIQSLTINELHGKYDEIFARSHNRNAASHLWATYILDR